MQQRSSMLVVKQHQPWKLLMLAILFVLALAASAWGLFHYGRSTAGQDYALLQEQKTVLLDKVARLESANQGLREQKAVLEHGGQIEKQAYAQVKTSLKALQDEILELKEEVAFYRSIVAPNESSKGLRIQSFKLESNGQPRGYRYKLVLTQVIKNNRVTRGNVDVVIEGLQGNKPTELNLKNITATKKANNLSFKFKYFQNFEGDILLPEGFVPSRAKVTVKSNRTNIDKTYEWPREATES